MKACEQTQGQDMLQHGKAVYKSYCDLISAMDSGVFDNETLQQLYARFKNKLPPVRTLKKYMILHDCGKYLCLEVDCNGRRHFPNHAEWSSRQYSHLFPEDGFTAALIRHDMDFHILRGDDLLRLWKSPFAPALYFTAWAEISANAEMFGGKQSDSYKIKRSRLIQAGKKYLNSIKEN